ncbi:hypothetical protein MNEG_2472 [Monoraphidium neglectum]|uniref:Uncharacterized protein n=1 Tax=Monoraphidium neglectum TaxID=145388 RepID=A0A0D2MSH2_9CHLO|nr:hypothetical protein MNEG_2472 [Monoraphidium neglectum]KIZ05490.1 hypothetical protein MNEG_2472 [Monoraphidium neglectum]|eukprot:XP_013904509.1 hypothetical protein MNEG_2472 [Monoraphidium neglectum]
MFGAMVNVNASELRSWIAASLAGAEYARITPEGAPDARARRLPPTALWELAVRNSVAAATMFHCTVDGGEDYVRYLESL